MRTFARDTSSHVDTTASLWKLRRPLYRRSVPSVYTSSKSPVSLAASAGRRSVENACPLCNKSDFTYMRDHGLERSLKEFEVWCSNKTKGCDQTGRVTSGEYAVGRGFYYLLAHSNLEYNAAKKTQYLKDNQLIIHVVKVELK